MKKVLGLAIAGLLSTSALAGNIKLDHDGDGDFLEISKLNLVSTPQVYTLTQYLGDDGIFNDGDLFTESVAFSINSFSDWDNNLFNDMFDADLAAFVPGAEAEMRLEADLEGHVSDVVVDNAQLAADLAVLFASAAYQNATAAEQALMEANVAFNNTSFKINFDLGTVKLFTDTANGGDFSTNQWDQIGQWTNVGGSGDSPADTNGKPSTDFGFQMDFDADWFNLNPGKAALWQAQSGNSLFDGAAPDLMTVAMSTINSSARPQSITGFGFDQTGGQFMSIEVLDDGGSMEFSIPEPTSIAILGLGLLGLAGARRRA